MSELAQCAIGVFIIGGIASALLIWACCVVSGRCSRQEEVNVAEWKRQNRIDAQWEV